MHEWSLAYAVIGTTLDYCRKKRAKKARVSILVGELQQIEMEIFKFALDEIISAHSECVISYSVRVEKAAFKCRACGKEWSFNKKDEKLSKESAEFVHFVPDVIHAFTRCPACGSPDFEITKGRGVSIESIKVN